MLMTLPCGGTNRALNIRLICLVEKNAACWEFVTSFVSVTQVARQLYWPKIEQGAVANAVTINKEAKMLSAPTNCEGKGESERQGDSNNKESGHWMWQGIPDKDEEELVECDLLNGTWNTYCDNAQIEDYEDEKGPELVENDCVFASWKA
jgi:hypothetical protein